MNWTQHPWLRSGLLSVLLLGERLWLYHLVGILLVAAGIVLATLWSPDSGR